MNANERVELISNRLEDVIVYDDQVIRVKPGESFAFRKGEVVDRVASGYWRLMEPKKDVKSTKKAIASMEVDA